MAKDDLKDDLLTAEEAGQLLGLKAETIRKKGQRGELPAIRINSRVTRFRRADVLALAEPGPPVITERNGQLVEHHNLSDADLARLEETGDQSDPADVSITAYRAGQRAERAQIVRWLREKATADYPAGAVVIDVIATWIEEETE